MSKEKEIFKSKEKIKSAEYTFEDIVGYDDIKAKAQFLSKADVDILLQGETGVGKEMFAEAIHNESKRKEKRFVVVDCTSIPEKLFESELFGHKKGSFTDAHEDKEGKIEYADGGTIFLDEISELPLESQAKLLRVLETKRFSRVGENKERKFNGRFILSTNKNLDKLRKEGKFREDLLFRINSFFFYIPPLREKKKEIPKIVDYYWMKLNEERNTTIDPPSKHEVSQILKYNFPGNVRELKNFLSRVHLYSSLEKNYKKRKEILQKEIKILLREEKIKSLDEIIEEHIRYVLNRTNSIREAARVLGISRMTLYRKIKRFHIDIL
ncbi:MAG: sigma-54 dependent transcriptional regulator [Acidobacteriota bacterium]